MKFYANYARNRVVFWENLNSWHKFYTTAGRDGRDNISTLDLHKKRFTCFLFCALRIWSLGGTLIANTDVFFILSDYYQEEEKPSSWTISHTICMNQSQGPSDGGGGTRGANKFQFSAASSSPVIWYIVCFCLFLPKLWLMIETVVHWKFSVRDSAPVISLDLVFLFSIAFFLTEL